MEENKRPHYINDPVINRLTAPENKLHRPKIYFVRAGITIVEDIVLIIIASMKIRTMIMAYENGNSDDLSMLTLKILLTLALLALVISFKNIMIWAIRIYQRYAKSETRLRCCFTPSCSDYAILALDKYGVIIGSVKAFGRLKRCHPPGGIDYP